MSKVKVVKKGHTKAGCGRMDLILAKSNAIEGRYFVYINKGNYRLGHTTYNWHRITPKRRMNLREIEKYFKTGSTFEEAEKLFNRRNTYKG